MPFNFEEALVAATTKIAQRKVPGGVEYAMYVSNDTKRYAHKYKGRTVKTLIADFRRDGGEYRYALIARIEKDGEKTIRFFDRTISKKFFATTRIGKSKKA